MPLEIKNTSDRARLGIEEHGMVGGLPLVSSRATDSTDTAPGTER